MLNKRKFPVRVYSESMGYNYACEDAKGQVKLLFEGVLFKYATRFDETGHAEVETYSGEKMKIDSHGNFCWIWK